MSEFMFCELQERQAVAETKSEQVWWFTPATRTWGWGRKREMESRILSQRNKWTNTPPHLKKEPYGPIPWLTPTPKVLFLRVLSYFRSWFILRCILRHSRHCLRKQKIHGRLMGRSRTQNSSSVGHVLIPGRAFLSEEMRFPSSLHSAPCENTQARCGGAHRHPSTGEAEAGGSKFKASLGYRVTSGPT